ncbi:hypothetical protein ACE193_24270 [Bernardetia sp. OM2101]|uniref:hypothetical protein n=1 Tax=Bernardetia sp. OM2101 TaxID=3344876 RepID=UPI0035CFEDA6
MKKYNLCLLQFKFFFFVIFPCLVFSISSCDKCADTECFTPPESFYFQLIDKETNQNLLQNGTYTLSDIRIKSIAENKVHTLKIDSIESNGQKKAILIDNEIGWENGNDNKNYILSIKDSVEYSFVHYSKKKRGDCCTFYELEEISSLEIEIITPDFNEFFVYKLAL